MQHLLKKQVIDLEIGTSLNAYAVQHSISHHFWKHIYPLLEKIFDELGSEDEIIKLDTLEIDLGCITQEYLDLVTWPASYLLEIEQKLRTGLQSRLEEKKASKEPRETVIFRQWLFYMEHGHLPWNCIDLSKESTTVLESLATEYSSITALRELLRKEAALNRIILQHKEIFLQQLVAVLTTKNQDGLISFVDEIMQLPGMPQKPKEGSSFLPIYHARKNIWQQVLAFASGKEQPDLQELMHQILLKHINNGEAARILIGDPSVKKLSIYSIITKIASSFPASAFPASAGKKNTQEKKPQEDVDAIQALPSNVKAKDQPVDKNEQELTGRQNEKIDGQPVKHGEKYIDENKIQSQEDPSAKNDVSLGIKNDFEQPAQETATGIDQPFHSPKNDQTKAGADAPDEFGLSNLQASGPPDLEEGWFIDFAGLVLVHPFLPTLFKKLNWVENGKFISPDDHQRGLYLLHYLATDTTEAEEYELVIAKLLCGYPLQMPVAKDINIDAEAIQEADNMLEALIEQWEILKQTSAAGLRQGFLQRNGKLYTKNEKLYLHVESGPIDMLLDHLPWNLSMIKLPWMKDILRVEWR